MASNVLQIYPYSQAFTENHNNINITAFSILIKPDIAPYLSNTSMEFIRNSSSMPSSLVSTNNSSITSYNIDINNNNQLIDPDSLFDLKSSNLSGTHQELSIFYVIFITIVLSIIDITTLMGNLLVVIAVLTTKSLHTVTNTFIMSLAVADMLVAVFVMPISIYMVTHENWKFGNIICDLWISCDVMLCTASILNLCCISLDRYFAITRPLTYSRQRSPKLARTMIAIVWIGSILISCPPVFGWKDKNRDENTCALNLLLSYRIYSSMGSFFLPCIIMIFVYSRIFKVIHDREKYLTNNSSRATTFLMSDKKLNGKISKQTQNNRFNGSCVNSNDRFKLKKVFNLKRFKNNEDKKSVNSKSNTVFNTSNGIPANNLELNTRQKLKECAYKVQPPVLANKKSDAFIAESPKKNVEQALNKSSIIEPLSQISRTSISKPEISIQQNKQPSSDIPNLEINQDELILNISNKKNSINKISITENNSNSRNNIDSDKNNIEKNETQTNSRQAKEKPSQTEEVINYDSGIKLQSETREPETKNFIECENEKKEQEFYFYNFDDVDYDPIIIYDDDMRNNLSNSKNLNTITNSVSKNDDYKDSNKNDNKSVSKTPTENKKEVYLTITNSNHDGNQLSIINESVELNSSSSSLNSKNIKNPYKNDSGIDNRIESKHNLACDNDCESANYEIEKNNFEVGSYLNNELDKDKNEPKLKKFGAFSFGSLIKCSKSGCDKTDSFIRRKNNSLKLSSNEFIDASSIQIKQTSFISKSSPNGNYNKRTSMSERQLFITKNTPNVVVTPNSVSITSSCANGNLAAKNRTETIKKFTSRKYIGKFNIDYNYFKRKTSAFEIRANNSNSFKLNNLLRRSSSFRRSSRINKTMPNNLVARKLATNNSSCNLSNYQSFAGHNSPSLIATVSFNTRKKSHFGTSLLVSSNPGALNKSRRSSFVSSSKNVPKSRLNIQLNPVRNGGNFSNVSMSSYSSNNTLKVTNKLNLHLVRNNLNNSSGNNQEQMRLIKESKAAKTLAIVVGGFILSWLPFFTMYVIEAILPRGTITKSVSDTITWLGYFNSAINPIIYAFYSKQFRSAFYRLTFGKFTINKSNPKHYYLTNNQYYYLNRQSNTNFNTNYNNSNYSIYTNNLNRTKRLINGNANRI